LRKILRKILASAFLILFINAFFVKNLHYLYHHHHQHHHYNKNQISSFEKAWHQEQKESDTCPIDHFVFFQYYYRIDHIVHIISNYRQTFVYNSADHLTKENIFTHYFLRAPPACFV